MPKHKPNAFQATQVPMAAPTQRNEQGGGGGNDPARRDRRRAPDDLPCYADVDFAHLRARVVALENLVISMLGKTSDEQLDRVRLMAAYISPREGFTQHRVTIHAAQQINHLVDRALYFRDVSPGESPDTRRKN